MKMDLTRMRPEKQGIMAVIVIKEREMKIETRSLGDININALAGLQINMPGISPIEVGKSKETLRGATSKAPEPVSKTSITDVQMEEGDSLETIPAEETFKFGPENIAQEVTIQTEGEQQISTSRTSTPRPQSQTEERETSSRKRKYSKKPKYVYSESSEEEVSEEKEEKQKKMKKRDSRKKSEGEEEEGKKTRAKDGRKLVDLSNRIRDSKGRILGYKPGTQPAKIQIKKKKPPVEQQPVSESTTVAQQQPVSKPTPITQTKKAMIKMPMILPKPATLLLKIKIQKMTKSDTCLPKTPTDLAFDTPVTLDISRARSMQPSSTFCSEQAPRQRLQPEQGRDAVEIAEEASQELEDYEEEALPATQPYTDEDGQRTTTTTTAESGGGTQPIQEEDRGLDQ